MALRVFGSALIAVCLAAAEVGAQAPNSQLPPRDVRPAPSRTGTAVIRGRVVDGQTARALRRVKMTLTAPELGREAQSTHVGSRSETCSSFTNCSEQEAASSAWPEALR